MNNLESVTCKKLKLSKIKFEYCVLFNIVAYTIYS